MGTDTLADPDEGITPTNRGGGSLYGALRAYQQDAAANIVAGVLDLPGDLAAGRQASGTTEGTEGECAGGETGTSVGPVLLPPALTIAAQEANITTLTQLLQHVTKVASQTRYFSWTD